MKIFVQLFSIFLILLYFSCEIKFNAQSQTANVNPKNIEVGASLMKGRADLVNYKDREIETVLKSDSISTVNFNRYDYIKGTKDGWFYEVRENKITLKTKIKKDTFHGIFWTFFPSGKIRSAGTNKMGKKDGLWIQFHPNGQQLNSGYWENGNEVGEWIYYDETGVVYAQKNFFGETNYCKFTSFYKKDSITVTGYLLNGLKEEEWSKFKKGNLIEKANYEKDILNGKFQEWYADGRYAISNYKNGKVDGNLMFYEANGELIKLMQFSNDSLLESIDLREELE